MGLANKPCRARLTHLHDVDGRKGPKKDCTVQVHPKQLFMLIPTPLHNIRICFRVSRHENMHLPVSQKWFLSVPMLYVKNKTLWDVGIGKQSTTRLAENFFSFIYYICYYTTSTQVSSCCHYFFLSCQACHATEKKIIYSISWRLRRTALILNDDTGDSFHKSYINNSVQNTLLEKVAFYKLTLMRMSPPSTGLLVTNLYPSNTLKIQFKQEGSYSRKNETFQTLDLVVTLILFGSNHSFLRYRAEENLGQGQTDEQLENIIPLRPSGRAIKLFILKLNDMSIHHPSP